MKELTTIVTLEITAIQKGSDESTEIAVEENMKEIMKREVAKMLANRLGVDDVVVTKIQNFVMDK